MGGVILIVFIPGQSRMHGISACESPYLRCQSVPSFWLTSFEQAPERRGPRQLFGLRTQAPLPATQGQRSMDASSLLGASQAMLRGRSQEATVGGWLKSARQSGSSDGLQVCVI